jgi:hypothetical protein
VYQIDVLIEFNNKLYNITAENPEIIIKAPLVYNNTNFTIIASKDGYKTAVANISIINRDQQNVQQLIITLLDDDFIIEAGAQFSVLVTNKTGVPISNAIVGIQSYTSEGSVGITDINGRTRLIAPEDRNEIIVIAQKDGYNEGTEKIWVHAKPSILDTIIQNPFTPIILAALVLLSAIIFVNLRQKRKKYSKEKSLEISKQNIDDYKRKGKHDTFISRNNTEKESYQHDIEEGKLKSNNGAKVEEIRISRPKKTKQIVSVNDEVKKKIKSDKIKVKKGNDWFEGTEDIMHEIDKITGIIDEKGRDKWFEGTDNIRAKIDEKLKMKDKKKGK